MTRVHDAVIIGGGPAGATAALLLARAGWSVALVERKTFPRRKVCGEYISATNLPLFDRLGVGERFRDLAGGPVRKVALFAGQTMTDAALPRPDGDDWGRALARDHLDTWLLEQAGAEGAEVFQPCSVNNVRSEGDNWRAELRKEPGIRRRRVPQPGCLRVTARLKCHCMRRSSLPRTARGNQVVRPAEITHLVTVSCTGFVAPGFDIGLIKTLGLPATVQRTHVGFMGCHGALNGLRVASAYADALPGARVLLCATEICSIHYYYPWNPKRIVGNALFADGSAALVGAAPMSKDAWHAVAHGSCLFADSEHAMGWTIGNHGFEMTLSAKVPQLIAANLRPWLEEWLASHGLTIGDVGSWAIHPGGPRVLTAVEETLGLIPGVAWASQEILAQHGNMSSPTVLFIVDRLRAADAPRPCVALGFGPGLVVEGALFC